MSMGFVGEHHISSQWVGPSVSASTWLGRMVRREVAASQDEILEGLLM